MNTAVPQQSGVLDRLLAVVCAVATGLCGSGIFLGPAPLSLQLAVIAIVVLAATRTGDALLLVAAFAPLGGVLAPLSGSPRSWTIPLVLALLFGAAIRAALTTRVQSDRPSTRAAAVWIALVLLSLGSELWPTLDPDAFGSESIRSFATWLTHEFPLIGIGRYPDVHAAVLAAGGGALFALTAALGRRDDRLVPAAIRLLVISVAAVGAINVYRLAEVAARRPPFLTSLVEFHQTLRISAVFGDVNAAGALFLMVLPAACSLLWTRGDRLLAIAAIPWLIAGLWLSGSKSALALLPVALGLLFLARRREAVIARTRRRILILIGLLLTAAILSTAIYAQVRPSSRVGQAIAVRRDLVTTTLRMARSAPWFGVGIGRYYKRSAIFIPETLRKSYRTENAHNQFLQVLGELGITGLVAFVVLIVVGVAPAVRRVTHGPTDVRLAGLTMGVGAFLVVSLGMHPLLIPEVMMAFCVALGLTRAAGTGPLPNVVERSDVPVIRARTAGSS